MQNLMENFWRSVLELEISVDSMRTLSFLERNVG